MDVHGPRRIVPDPTISTKMSTFAQELTDNQDKSSGQVAMKLSADSSQFGHSGAFPPVSPSGQNVSILQKIFIIVLVHCY